MNDTFMKEKPIFPLLVSMALPMVISMLVNALYNIVDSLFVAQISEDAMTALSLVYPVQNLINAIAIGFGVGINAQIALHLGAGEHKKANMAATHGLMLSLLHGVVINVVSNPNVFSSQEAIVLGWLAIPLTVLWIVGITNSVNLIDGLDGLAVGVSTISCVTILVVALLVSEPNVALIVAALAGACIGFMPYNLNHARIFMGDTGSLLLGYVLATVSVLGLFKFYAIVTFVVPVLALAVPLSDTLFAFCRRILHGQSPFHADRGHFHHKLMDLGLNQKQAVAILYAISATLGLAAVVLTTKGSIRIALLILALLIGFVVCAFIRKSVHKHHIDVELQEAQAAADARTDAEAAEAEKDTASAETEQDSDTTAAEAPAQEVNDEQTH